MQQLLNFFFKNRTLILFLFLLSVSFGLTINSQDYQKSKFINSSAWVSGSIHTLFSDIGDYFYLKKSKHFKANLTAKRRFFKEISAYFGKSLKTTGNFVQNTFLKINFLAIFQEHKFKNNFPNPVKNTLLENTTIVFSAKKLKGRYTFTTK